MFLRSSQKHSFTSSQSSKFSFLYPSQMDQYKEECLEKPSKDPRDIKVLIHLADLQQRLTHIDRFDDELKSQIRKWLVRVYQDVTSDAFYKYDKGDLQQGQVKAYTAKNYLLNIIHMMQSVANRNGAICQQIFQFIDKESHSIIKELILKYPQSQAKASVKKLKKIIERPDNRQSDQFDLFLNPKKTDVSFIYREDKNYSSEIMKALNYIMQISTKPLHESNQFDTNFDGFQTLLENLFNYAGYCKFEKEFLKEAQQYQRRNTNEQKSKLFDKLFTTQGRQYDQKLKKNIVDKQGHFKINQKIPSDVNIFKKTQIESGMFRVPDVSVLRVMTKWAQELRQKLTNGYQQIQKRVQRFKNQKGQLIELVAEQKDCLYQAIKQEEAHIKDVIQKLQSNFKSMGTKMSKDNPQALYTNEDNAMVGTFAARTQTCIGRYIFVYLNQLIHSLLKVPMRAKQLLMMGGYINEKQKRQAQLQNLNLVSFKIGDLLRAKCKSNEKHIIEIYSLLAKMTQKCPNIIKIIRVKDRLDMKDKDLLINLFFMNKIQCQIQLSVTSDINPKQQHYNSLNHFIYQLKRSQFGPIAQCACILAQYDPVIKNYTQRQQLSPEIKIEKNYIKNFNRSQYSSNNTPKQKTQQHIHNLPFYCDLCKKFDTNKNQYFYINKISNSQLKQCNQCYQKSMSLNQTKDIMIQQVLRYKYSPEQIKTIQNHFQIVDIDKIKNLEYITNNIQIGLITSKNNFKPQPSYFESVLFDQKYYCVCGQQNGQTIKGSIIFSLSRQKKWKQILKNQIIIIPKNIKLCFIDQQQNMVIHKCDCCSIKEIKLGRLFNAYEDTIKIQNLKLCKDNYLSLKQTFYTANRQISTQMDSCINKQNKSVKRFYGQNNKIQSMQFTKHFKKMQFIDMSNNQLQKIEGINDIISINTIILNQNKIKVIQNLDKLKSLISLSLNNNEITQLNNLSQLLSLINLSLSSNQIKQLQNIEKLKSLNTLNLSQNKISEIKNLQNLISLTALNLFSNQITQMKNLNKLTNLLALNLGSNQITKIKQLEQLKNLQTLNLQYNQIEKIQNLESLISLKNLNLYCNLVTEIQNIQNLKNLKFLYLGENQISQIKNLNQLKLLKTLSLCNNHKITEIKNLDNLHLLQNLDLTGNQIKQITNLQNMINLKILSLGRNKIEQIKNLQKLSSLQTLYLNNNQIKQINNIQNLKQLTTLNLQSNKIKQVKSLSKNLQITKLYLKNNQLSQNNMKQYLCKRKNRLSGFSI